MGVSFVGSVRSSLVGPLANVVLISFVVLRCCVFFSLVGSLSGRVAVGLSPGPLWDRDASCLSAGMVCLRGLVLLLSFSGLVLVPSEVCLRCLALLLCVLPFACSLLCCAVFRFLGVLCGSCAAVPVLSFGGGVSSLVCGVPSCWVFTLPKWS